MSTGQEPPRLRSASAARICPYLAHSRCAPARRVHAAQNVVVPSATLNSDGSLNRWGVGWMSRLNNGDAIAARLDPRDTKLDVRYDRQCDDGSQWRINANLPSLSSGNVLSDTEWSVTRAWSK